MLKYNNRIVITGGSGRFASAFKKIKGYKSLNLYYPEKNKLDILNIKSIQKYLKYIKPKYLIHLAGLSRP